MRNMLSGNQERTLMKIVVDGKSGKLLGVHIAGEDAPEMIQLAAVAVKAGLTKKQWDSTMALHPTAAEELVLMREKVAAPGSAELAPIGTGRPCARTFRRALASPDRRVPATALLRPALLGNRLAARSAAGSATERLRAREPQPRGHGPAPEETRDARVATAK